MEIGDTTASGSLGLGVLEAVTAVASLMLRLTVPYFLRYFPIGPRLLPIIYGNGMVYFGTFAFQVWLKRPRRRKTSKLWTAACGRFDPTHKTATILSFSINALLLLATWDFIYRGHLLHEEQDLLFSRVGHLDASSARIVLRSPGTGTVRVQWQEVDKLDTTPWDSQTLTGLAPESDYTTTALIGSLRSNTLYHYKTDVGHTGSFRTARSDTHVFTIVTSSCIIPFFPYNPFDHSLRIVGLEHLTAFVHSHVVDFALFLGDFIYIDLPHNFGWSASHYWTAYRQVYASPSWSQELLALPFIHMYDDHEIINDWSANNTGLYKSAITAYEHYQQHANPPPFRPGVKYFSFRHGDVSFFIMDNRRFRSGPEVTDEAKRTMLGAQQFNDLVSWLRTEKNWKVIVTGVPFTRNWRNIPDERDSWAGYLHERQKLLEVMWETEGVVIISGDRHEHATTVFPSPEGKTNVIEFSTSPLNQFYEPFERSYKQVEDTDVEVFSHVSGVSKFGGLTFNTSAEDQMRVLFELVVDGTRTWEYEWTLNRY